MSSVRRATQCLGKQSSRSGRSSPLIPGRLSIPSSPMRWLDERETRQLIRGSASPRASSPGPQVSERLFRSCETVKAWLESSPTSVLDDHHLDGDSSAHSSFESFGSSPMGSPFHRSVNSSRFLSPCPSVPRHPAGVLSPCPSTHQQPGHVRVRAISPPRCPATNVNPKDVSRIDAAQSTYFASLAVRKIQTESNVCEEAEECCDTPRSEFSLTSEWQNMLAAGTAAGMSTRDGDSSSGNHSEYENLSYSTDPMYRAHLAHAQVMRPEPCRIRSMELPKPSPRLHDPKLERQQYSAPQQLRTVHYDMNDIDRISGRIAERSRSIDTSFAQKMHQQQHRAVYNNNSTKQAEVKRVSLFEKMQSDIVMAFRMTEEKKAKRAEKAAARAAEPRLTRKRSHKIRGCLFLG